MTEITVIRLLTHWCPGCTAWFSIGYTGILGNVQCSRRTAAGWCRGKCWLCSDVSCGRTDVTDSGGACTHADSSSRWGCGRTTVACRDSVAEHCGEAAGNVAVSGCSRYIRARCSVKNGWPLALRSNCRSAETNRTERSFRLPSPERRKTATTSPSCGRFPSLHRLLARAVFQKHPPTAVPHFCNTRCLSLWSCHFALQSCVGGECGCRCRSSLQIPERFPKCASRGNWQVPSAPAGSKRSRDPLESRLSTASSRENGGQIGNRNFVFGEEDESYSVGLLGVLEVLHVCNLVWFFKRFAPAPLPVQESQYGATSTTDQRIRMSEGFKSLNTPPQQGQIRQVRVSMAVEPEAMFFQ